MFTVSAATAVPSPITGEKKSRGSKKRSREKDKLPKLTVLEVNEAATVVECQLESKSKTVTFKFDVTDVNPEEIASNLVNLISQKSLVRIAVDIFNNIKNINKYIYINLQFLPLAIVPKF